MIDHPNYMPKVLQVIAAPGGTAAWDLAGTRDETRCIDLDPLVLYRTTPEIEEFAWVTLASGTNRSTDE